MASDPHLEATLDRILSGMRGQLEAGLRRYAEELNKASSAERARAVEQASEEVRRQAQGQLAQLRDAARKQTDELRRSAESQIAELRRLLDDLRENAQRQIDAARKTLDTELAAARARAASDVEDVRRVAHAQVEDVQRAGEARLQDTARELDTVKGELAHLRRQVADEQDRAARAVEAAERHLADDIRDLDDSSSLRQALDRLVELAARRAERVALSMTDVVSAARPEYGVSDKGVALFPVTVGGAVVAVLHAERPDSGQGHAGWASDLEVLTRHAGRVLEAITIEQAAGMARPSHREKPQPASGGLS